MAEPRKRSRFDAGLERGPHAPAAAAPPAAHTRTQPNATGAIAGGMSASAIAAAAMEAAQRAAILKAQQLVGTAVVAPPHGVLGMGASGMEAPTAASLGHSLHASGAKTTFKPPPITLDAAGKPIDDALASVMAIPIRPVTSLKVNEPNRTVPGKGSKHARMDAQAGGTVSAAAAGAMGEAVPVVNPYLAHRVSAASKPEGEEVDSGIVDPRLAAAARTTRPRKGLDFVEVGTISAAADQMREMLARKAAAAAVRGVGGRSRPLKHFEIDSAVEAESTSAQAPAGAAASAASARAELLRGLPQKLAMQTPDLEWWDAAFLPPARQKSYAAKHATILGGGKKALLELASKENVSTEEVFTVDECQLSNSKTWKLVQHPVPVTGVEEQQPTSLPLMLTKRERKRLRRQQRAERHKEVQDQIRMGLLPPPEPKVRLANLMRVLLDAAVADPSAVEARVRAQVAQRVKDHEMRNLAKKLTPGERREKWRKKMTAHSAYGPEVALFRVRNLDHRQVRFKIDVNAKETYLTGIVLMCKDTDVALVLVEGGTRAVRKYVRLMMERIDWVSAQKAVQSKRDADESGSESEESEDEDEDDEDERPMRPGVTPKGAGSGLGSLCEMVWRGTAPRRHFTEFKFEEVRSLGAGRRLMETKGLAHLWDAVVNSARAAAADGAEHDGDVLGSLAQPTLASIQSSFHAGGFLATGSAPSAGAAAASTEVEMK